MATEETPPAAANVSANVALLDDFIQTDYDAAVHDARGLSTRAAGLLAANAGVLTIAATIAPSVRDAGDAGHKAVEIAAVLAVLSIVIAILGALPRPTLAISITGLSRLLAPEALEQDPLNLRGELLTTRTQELARLRAVIARATLVLQLATICLILALAGLASAVSLVVAEPSHPDATHVVVDSLCAQPPSGRGHTATPAPEQVAGTTCQLLVKVDRPRHTRHRHRRAQCEHVRVRHARWHMCHH
ncbi:MAG: hypothetical protein ACRDLF_13685 [Solirubrobacteraceae bacterium]